MIKIDRWLDLDSEEYLSWPQALEIKNNVNLTLRLNTILDDDSYLKIDSNGILYEDGDIFHRKFPTETVGLKWVAKAAS